MKKWLLLNDNSGFNWSVGEVSSPSNNSFSKVKTMRDAGKIMNQFAVTQYWGDNLMNLTARG